MYLTVNGSSWNLACAEKRVYCWTSSSFMEIALLVLCFRSIIAKLTGHILKRHSGWMQSISMDKMVYIHFHNFFHCLHLALIGLIQMSSIMYLNPLEEVLYHCGLKVGLYIFGLPNKVIYDLIIYFSSSYWNGISLRIPGNGLHLSFGKCFIWRWNGCDSSKNFKKIIKNTFKNLENF